MSKTDNIKRAKKLREAKKKRELDALIAAGLGPAPKPKKKNDDDVFRIIKNFGNIKYSDLLKEFVYPLLVPTDDLNSIRTKFQFGFDAWNAGTLKENNEIAYLLARKKASISMRNDPQLELLFDEMVERRQTDFADYRNTFKSFEIKPLRGDKFDLTVMASL